MNEKKKTNSNEDKQVNIFIYIGCILAGMAIVSPFLAYGISKYLQTINVNKYTTLKDYVLELGPLGDFTAGTTVPLLTFAGFIVLIGTMFMQKRELGLTRTELYETQQIIKEQSETMLLQRFENTFFQLLTLHNENVQQIKLTITYNHMGFSNPNREKNYLGKESFPFYKDILFKKYLDELNFSKDIDGLHQSYLQIRSNYNDFFNQHRNELGHYFRNLFRFIKFIDNFAGLDFEKKSDYIDLIRAQLSPDEISLLLYNGLSQHGEPFLDFIIKYDLLDGITSKDVHDVKVIQIFKHINDVKEREKAIKQLVIT